MILTKEELSVLKHHYRVKSACAEAQGLINDVRSCNKSIEGLEESYKLDLVTILREGD